MKIDVSNIHYTKKESKNRIVPVFDSNFIKNNKHNDDSVLYYKKPNKQRKTSHEVFVLDEPRIIDIIV